MTASVVTYGSGANLPEASQRPWDFSGLFRTDHKTIGLNYLWLALISVFLAMGLSLLMRIHLVWPSVRFPFV